MLIWSKLSASICILAAVLSIDSINSGSVLSSIAAETGVGLKLATELSDVM